MKSPQCPDPDQEEEVEEEIPDEKKCTDAKKCAPWNTGYFHDGLRRVDLVLVMRYSDVQTCELDVEEQQINCLMDLADCGFDLEIEPGTALDHRHLVFVKLHCPDAMVQEYGTYFNMRKYFRLQHLQYMQEGITAENDLIALARTQYPGPVGYTTLDRSMIVYRMLRVMAFNRTIKDSRGIQCLLDYNVVSDVFALHDGPYFMLPGQSEETATARQALYYGWQGWRNLYKGQPTHLLREYFGERVAFVFAFAETLVKVLTVLSIIGAIVFIVGIHNYKKNHQSTYTSVCNTNLSYYIHDFDTVLRDRSQLLVEGLTMCPSCRDFSACPFRDLSTYCREVYLKTVLDSPPAFIAALIAAIVSWVFFFKWWRREDQFMWLWEIPLDSSLNTTRVNFREKTVIPTGKRICPRIQRSVLVVGAASIILFLCIWLISFHYKLLRMTTDLIELFEDFHRRKYLVLMMLGMMNGAIIVLLDWPYRWLSYKLAKAANHLTDRDFEWSLMLKRIGFSFLIHYSLFYYYGVIKGTFYTYPADPRQWRTFLGIGMSNCGVLGCFDELFIDVVTTAVACRSFAVVAGFFRIESCDYSWRRMKDEPCWEREYRLKPFKESAVMDLLHNLILKYMHSTLLMAVFPLAPCVILPILLWDIRSEAGRLLLCRRRPLLVKRYGLGTWRWALMLLPLLIGLSNAVVVALNTTMFDRLAVKTHFASQNFQSERWFHFLPIYMLSTFNISDFSLTPESMAELKAVEAENLGTYCFFPGKYSRKPSHGMHYWLQGGRQPDYHFHILKFHSAYYGTQLKYYIHWEQALFVLAFQVTIAVCGAALWYEYWKEYEPLEPEERQAAEDTVRDYATEVEQILIYKKKLCGCQQQDSCHCH